MKTSIKRGILLALASGFFILGSTAPSFADGPYWAPHYRYYDRAGYYDNHHYYHHYEYYHSHRGYWDQRNGVRVFISL